MRPGFPEPANEADRLHYEAINRMAHGAFDEGEALLKQALAAGEELPGSEHGSVAEILNSLGGVCADRNSLDEAEAHFRRALTIWEQSLGMDAPQVASSVLELAKLFRRRGCFAEAEAMYLRGIAIREKALGPDSPQTAAAQSNLAALYRQQGRQLEAARLAQQAQSTIGQWMSPVFGAFEIAVKELDLGKAALNPDECADLEPHIHRSLRLTEHLVGPEHPSVATLLDQYAALLRKLERDAEAEEAEKRARNIRLKTDTD